MLYMIILYFYLPLRFVYMSLVYFSLVDLCMSNAVLAVVCVCVSFA